MLTKDPEPRHQGERGGDSQFLTPWLRVMGKGGLAIVTGPLPCRALRFIVESFYWLGIPH